MFANMNPSIVHDLEKFHPKAYSIFHNHKYNFLYKVLKESIERGIAEGMYREDIDADITVKARLESMMMAFNQQVFPKAKYSLVEVETRLTENYLFGLASQKGHKLILKYQQARLNKSINDKKK